MAVTLSESAARHVSNFIARRGKGVGIRLGVKTSGCSGMAYKLEFVDDSKLKSMVGKRVEVVGRIDAESGDKATPAPGATTSTTDKVLGRDKVDLAEFEVSSIKEVAGSCPTTPSAQ